MKSLNWRFLAVAELAETALNRPEHMFPACDTDPERSHRSLRSHNIAQIVIDRIEGNCHGGKFLDMCLEFRCLKGCVVVLFGLPLSVVNHAFVVPAHVQVYRDEPLLRSEGLFGGVLQSFDKSFGAVWLHREGVDELGRLAYVLKRAQHALRTGVDNKL